MVNNPGVLFKGIFLLGGIIFLPWGLLTDSMVKTIGGLGLIFLGLVTDGN